VNVGFRRCLIRLKVVQLLSHKERDFLISQRDLSLDHLNFRMGSKVGPFSFRKDLIQIIDYLLIFFQMTHLEKGCSSICMAFSYYLCYDNSKFRKD
jgi:hypothetical protein